MCWSGAQTGLSHCSLYRLAGKPASMSLLVLHLFISGFRGNDDCLAASRASRSARSLAVFSRIACWAALYSACFSPFAHLVSAISRAEGRQFLYKNA